MNYFERKTWQDDAFLRVTLRLGPGVQLLPNSFAASAEVKKFALYDEHVDSRRRICSPAEELLKTSAPALIQLYAFRRKACVGVECKASWEVVVYSFQPH
ncbi:MAG: hypothetical protein ABR555_02795 [Pyrinomonadaceae bacterium]